MKHPFEGYIGYGIKQFYRAFNEGYDRELAEIELTAAQVNVLELLWTMGDGLTQKQLHEKLRISPASLSNLLDALVCGSWVERLADPSDARAKRVHLTEKGIAGQQPCMAIIMKLEAQARNGMAPEEVAMLTFLLKKAHGNFIVGQ